ncbi:ArnT family glycosyltransferase [Hydrogenobacter hydrogenophilus]|uniref:Dolichyl-phosphate-mannose-protein mannosyltransferase n=1 Tax=Hydrogenobacter hydrogenophilus TaxID=35835 RepID=A0A285P427_9AQUI|nr:glycosyltransferase family 39 protein [Hydrogenobacter hydrogenophilus]SNZ16485.1 Dolichyl-phosphate-mannose-protein mannosyltransferase [Hydrogenobacter hydrogenophilus]
MRLIILLLAGAILSLLPNLNTYEFRNEEALRLTVAYEMFKNSNYAQPYLLGEPYYNKPPLFNWLIVLCSYFLGWSELTGRAVSITFLVLCLLLLVAFTQYLFRNLELSLLSALVFLTSGNVLFFYGYLAEIDITFTFFVFSLMVCAYMWSQKDSIFWAFATGFLTGLSFLIKGFPAYAFYGLTLLALSVYKRDTSLLFGRKAFLAHATSFVLPTFWIVNTHDPLLYLKNLLYESLSRVKERDFSRVHHLITFPILTFKDTLPNSLLFLIALYLLLRQKELKFPPQIRVMFIMFFVNYLPYLFSNSAGRYVLPLYPLLAVMSSYYIYSALEKGNYKRIFYVSILLTIILRALYGSVFFPYYNERESSRKSIAMKMIKAMDLKKPVRCECPQELSVCLYVSLAKNEPLKKNLPDAVYSISCGDERKGKALISFDVNRSYQIKLLYFKSLPLLLLSTLGTLL